MRTPRRIWRFHLGGHPRRVPEGWTRLDAPLNNELLDTRRTQVGLSLAGLRANIGQQPPAAVEDLFTVAVAAYIADRRAPRAKSGAPRRIELSVPVAEPGIWNDSRTNSLLCALLCELTGDTWTVAFRQDSNPHAWQGQLIPVPVESVSLFSGGLDSFCHAATLRPAAKSGAV
ncbi:MAG: hypothetical protein ACRD0P_29480, partial [Stackebrandtia sp.]